MADSSAPEGPRRSRRLWLLVIGAMTLVVLVVGLAAYPEILRRVVIWQLATVTSRPVALGAFELSLFQGRLTVRDLRVMDHDRDPLVTIDRLEARFSRRDLLRGHLRVTYAVLQTPTARIVRTGPNEFNISDLLRRRRREPGGGLPLAVTVEQFALRAGLLALEDRTLAPARAWRVENITLDAQNVSSRPQAPPGVVTFSAVAAGAPISLWVSGVRLAPLTFHATAIARDIDGSLAALYFPPGSPLSPARATLDLSGTIEQQGAAGTRVTLDAVFGGVELRRPGQETAYLSAPAIRVIVEDLRLRPGAIELGRLAVDGGNVALEDTRLKPVRRWQAEGITLEAKNLSSARDAPAGVASLRAVVAGSPLTVWVAGVRLAPLELNATAVIRDVDFSLFRLYVPPGLPVQPEQGIVNASVHIEYDTTRGTRLALDAGLTKVEVRRPGHFVTAPALRLTAEDIAFGGGVVTVGRGVLRGDRLTLEDRTLRPPRTWAVQNLAVEASRLSSRREDVQGVATVRATVAGAAVSGWITHVRLAPLELRATAILRQLDLALVQLYLPPTVPVQLDRGTANASVQVDHDVAGGTRLVGDITLTGLEARGRGVADRLSVSAPALRVALAEGRRHETALTVGRIELTGNGSLVNARAAPPDPRPAAGDARAGATRLDFERLRIAGEGLTWPASGPARVELGARLRDGGEVTASGTALLTAPPPMIALTSELAVQLKSVSLGPVAAYVPAASGLNGQVSANVTASLAYGASLTARLQGEANGARLALGDGTRRLIAIGRFEATGLDVLWPERIAVGRLRLDRPRALVERDRQGVFPLAARFARPAVAAEPAESSPGSAASAPPTAAPPASAARSRAPALAAGEVVIERGSLAYVDARDRAAPRLDVPRIDLTLRDARWPGATPAQLRLDATLPEGGTVGAEGTILADPASVDLRIVVTDAGLSPIQPFLPFRAGVRGRLDANVTVAGPLAPMPRITARGDATVRSVIVSDGQRSVITVDRLRATGMDATWPERASVERVRVRRSWALIERDREGRFGLQTLLRRAPSPTPGSSPEPPAPAAPPATTPARTFEFRVGEGIFEEGAVTIVDAVPTPAARLEVTGARLAVRDFAWPSRNPIKVELTSPAPAGGRLDVAGTVELDPVRVQARATLDGVELAPAQPYVPIAARLAGRVTGDLTVKLGLDPIAVQVTGQASLQALRLSDGDRPLVTAGRAEAIGVDVDWPRRVALQQLLLRRPRLLIERNPRGEIELPRLLTPRWPTPGADGAPPAIAKPGAPPPSAAATAPPTPTVRPTIEIATVNLERGSGRFVDHTLTPPYTEELSRVNVTVTGLTTAPGGRARFTGEGALGGGGTVTFEGEATAEERPIVELKVNLRDVALPRVNPYLERYTSWTATRGTLNATATYRLVGTQLEARHDVSVRGLDVARTSADDEVERRLGLPLGLLVSVLKDARGEIRLSVPVAGDLSTRQFDFQEAVWGAVRALSIRLLALPFSKIGSLAISEDSKVEAITLAPIVFEAGSTNQAAGMTEHLDRVATFLRGAPSVNLRLAPILVQADLDALKRERPAGAPVPEETVRDLAARRLEAVRQALISRGIDAGRVAGSARRVPVIEGAGVARVELDIRPSAAADRRAT